MDRELGISRCKLLYVGWINNKVLLQSTGNCIQYPVINHSRKQYEKEYICITESLCSIAEINTVNQLYFNKTRLKKQEALVERRSFQLQHPRLWLEESLSGSVLYLVGCLAESLVSTCQMPGAPPSICGHQKCLQRLPFQVRTATKVDTPNRTF